MLSGATANHLDDFDNSVNVIESLIKDPRLVPGPGATELALNKRIEANGSATRKLVQHTVKRYATTLEFNPEHSLRMRWEVLRVRSSQSVAGQA